MTRKYFSSGDKYTMYKLRRFCRAAYYKHYHLFYMLLELLGVVLLVAALLLPFVFLDK